MIEPGRCHDINAWEQRPFGKVYTRCTEKNNPIRFGVDKIITVASMQYAPRHGCTNNEYLLTYNVMKLGDIAFEGNRNKRFPFGRFVENMIGEGIVSHVFSVYRPIVKQSSLLFLKYYINNDYVIRNMLRKSTIAATMMRTLVDADLMRQTLTLPSGREQEKIGKLFVDIDNLIDAEKRKLDLLEQRQEAYSQKVFSYGPYRGKTVKHWKTVCLGDVATRVTRRNKGQSKLPLTISAHDGLIDQRRFFSRQIASKNLDNYILLQRGEFAYNKSTSSDSPWGAIKRLDRYDQGCVSTLYICFSVHDVDPQFITALFNSPIWHREIQAIATEGARNHGLLNISPKDFFDIQLQIPDSLSEQKHVGRFFAAYEQLIRQTAKRIGLLETKKKALLQTMFI